MKIITRGNEFFIDPNTRQISGKTENNSGFNDILNQTLKKTDSESGLDTSVVTANTSNIVPFENLPKLSLVSCDPPKALNRHQLVDRIDNFLNMLEDYATHLEDATIDMHDIHPLMNKIKKENEYLKHQLPHLDPQDHLTFILESTLDTAEKELINFDKGQYVSIMK